MYNLVTAKNRCSPLPLTCNGGDLDSFFGFSLHYLRCFHVATFAIDKMRMLLTAALAASMGLASAERYAERSNPLEVTGGLLLTIVIDSCAVSYERIDSTSFMRIFPPARPETCLDFFCFVTLCSRSLPAPLFTQITVLYSGVIGPSDHYFSLL